MKFVAFLAQLIFNFQFYSLQSLLEPELRSNLQVISNIIIIIRL